jgi:hypothetical protein
MGAAAAGAAMRAHKSKVMRQDGRAALAGRGREAPLKISLPSDGTNSFVAPPPPSSAAVLAAPRSVPPLADVVRPS